MSVTIEIINRRRYYRERRDEGGMTGSMEGSFLDMASLRRKDENFWKELGDWNVIVMLETWKE